jgi:hypothetical protein
MTYEMRITTAKAAGAQFELMVLTRNRGGEVTEHTHKFRIKECKAMDGKAESA